MSKKKDKKKNKEENSAQKSSTEIDYKKFAKTIELARKVNKEKSKHEETTPTIGFWRKVWCVITNKNDDSTVSLTDSLAGLMSLFFNAVALILFITGLLCFAMIFVVIFQATNIQYLFSYIILTVLLPMIALIMRGIANEMEREKDKNYIISAFSGVVSFVALIVALIALFKEAG